MRPLFTLPLLALLLGGCGLPMALQLASLAVDGAAVVSTGKTTTDHAISAVAEKDCALFRKLSGEDICQAEANEIAERTGGQ